VRSHAQREHASLILRSRLCSLSGKKFFATCCVMVRRPAALSAAVVLQREDRRARDALEVEPAMLVEALVFRRDEALSTSFGIAWIGR